MIKEPVFLLLFLVVIEGLVLASSRSGRLRKLFDILPAVFFIYFLPMLASTVGLIDAKAPVLAWITTSILPAALFLLLVTVDVPAIFALGGRALGMFLIGSAGIIAGAAVAFALFKPIVGPHFWAGFGALSASWTGGSANMIAVKEAINVPDAVFLPMVVVDTVVPYVWMGLLIAAVSWQPVFDRWNRADRRVLEELSARTHAADPGQGTGAGRDRFSGFLFQVLAVLFAFGAGWACQALSAKLPAIPNVISSYAWTIIAVTALGLLASFTPLRRKMEAAGATRSGYWLLYLVLTAIGAKASLSQVSTSLLLIAAGFVIVFVHVLFLLAGARLLRAPLFLVAAASQANIGGVASAPVVAAVYAPGLSSVGLLLAILGNIIGTYLGILCGQLCRIFI